MKNEYSADWASLDTRPVPDWFSAAKFGIFIHWGVYSAPAWAPRKKQSYAEWYWHAMQDRNGPTWDFHKKTYGEPFRYQDFAPQFKAELFSPDEWADLFARSGARYVVLTAKHHDGYCLWPSAQSWNWNSVDIGPHRDLLGDLTTAVRARNLRMGLYCSLLEWFNPLIVKDPAIYVENILLPQLRDLVTRYEPSVIFTDGEWTEESSVWRSVEFLAWLFNESPIRDTVAVNDRWGKETRSCHGGYFTTEYGEVGGGKALSTGKVWEECRSIGESFGFNRNEAVETYLTEREVVHLLIRTVSRGGNLLLNIGPTADGRIPIIMQERLLQVGRWLCANGESIFDTVAGPLTEQSWGCSTARGKHIYLHVLNWPADGRLPLCGLSAKPKTAFILADKTQTPLESSIHEGEMALRLPALPPDPIANVVKMEVEFVKLRSQTEPPESH